MSVLPNIRREEQGWELTEVEVVDDAQRLRARGARPERACKTLAFAFGHSLLNPLCGRLAEASSVDFTDDGTQGALGVYNTLPHCRFPRRSDPGFPLRTDPALMMV
jgi:hypothetical protein